MKNYNRKGFSLLEMLLTVMVVMGLMTAVFSLLEDYAEKELAQSTSDYMENIALSVQDIVDSPQHFQALYDLANASPGGVLQISLADITAGFGPLIGGFPTIPASTRLNAAIRNRTPIGSAISIMVRVADDAASTTEALEVIVATDERIVDERVRRAATASGAYGGTFSAIGAPITSIFGGWEVDIADLALTAWGATANDPLAPPSQDNGTYLVHYRHTSFDDISGDYMYRVAVPGRPELNRMHTHLNMGAHNIMGTDDITVARDLTLEGRAMINGEMRVGGTTTIQQGNVTAGQRFEANNMIISGEGSGTTGNFTVDDSLTIGTLNVQESLNARAATLNGGLSAADITTQDLTLGGNLNVTSVNTTTLQGAGATALNIAGQLNASVYETNNLAITGSIGTLDTIITGNLNNNVGSVSAPNLNLGTVNFNGAAGGSFGICDKGC